MEGTTLETLRPLASIGVETLDSYQDLVLVDWAQYHDYFLVTGYNVINHSIIFCKLIKECTVAQVEDWVEEYLQVPDDELRDKLRSSTIFAKLWPLIQPLHECVKDGAVLIFSSSQILNSLPLHAIPYGIPEGYPVVFYHPVAYCPSAAILADVVERSMQQCHMADDWHGVFYGRFGDSNLHEEAAVMESIQDLSLAFTNAGGKVQVVTGSELTRETFTKNLSSVRLLHFHGHASG